MWVDFIIFLVMVVSAVIFCILGDGKIHKIYFWLIIGFLLYLVFNTQIQLLELLSPKELNAFQTFLFLNQELVLTLSIIGIPLLWLLFLLNTSLSIHVKNNILFSMLFGGFLPLFWLLLLSYVYKNTYIDFDFLQSISSIFTSSQIYWFFVDHAYWAIAGLLFLLFYRAFFLLLFAFLTWLYTVFRNEFFGEPEEEDAQQEE